MNNSGLPDPIYLALIVDDYDDGGADYTATTLIAPPQIVQLQRRYEKREELMDRFWSLMGNSVHNYVEQISKNAFLDCDKRTLIEHRFFHVTEGKVISGAIDYYHNGLVIDYKVTSAWTIIYGSKLKDWETQLNIYAYLLQEHGYKVDQLQIAVFLRDWMESKAKRDRSYPQTPIQIIEIPLWDTSKQEFYIHHRLSTHISNEHRSDDELTPCTAEEMWASDITYAVKKNTNKRAVRCLKTEKEALDYIDTVSKKDPKNKY